MLRRVGFGLKRAVYSRDLCFALQWLTPLRFCPVASVLQRTSCTLCASELSTV